MVFNREGSSTMRNETDKLLEFISKGIFKVIYNVIGNIFIMKVVCLLNCFDFLNRQK